MSAAAFEPFESFGRIVEDGERLKILRRKVSGMLMAKHDRFPGAQPVSLGRGGLVTLQRDKDRYFVCEKSDGTRYLLLIDGRRGSYLVERTYRFCEVNLRVPDRKRPGEFLEDTLLDGEMVEDHEGPEKKKVIRFLIFDVMWARQNVMNLKLPDRLGKGQNDVVTPLQQVKERKVKFAIQMKTFFKMKHLRYIFDTVIPSLAHENDGLIFTPVGDPYKAGQCIRLLKWKPASLNTVDFKICVEWWQRQPKLALYLMTTGVLQFHDWATLPDEIRSQREGVDDFGQAVVECVYDEDWITDVPDEHDNWGGGLTRKGGWRALRIRTDKTDANDSSIFERIQQSKRDNVTKEVLLDALADPPAPAPAPAQPQSQPQGHKRPAEDAQQDDGADKRVKEDQG